MEQAQYSSAISARISEVLHRDSAELQAPGHGLGGGFRVARATSCAANGQSGLSVEAIEAVWRTVQRVRWRSLGAADSAGLLLHSFANRSCRTSGPIIRLFRSACLGNGS
jgi:hypothetical protein